MNGRKTAAAETPQRTERMGGSGAVLSVQLERARRAGETSQTVILVEGVSDERAIETLARRRHRDLKAEGVAIVAIAGATNARRFLCLLGPHGYDVELAGLCDQGETSMFRRGLEEAGLTPAHTRADIEQLGFYVCVNDLEEELIRALGAEAVLDLIGAQGHLKAFRSFQNQPAQRGRIIERQLWRWMGNRKIRYAGLLVDALDLDRVPTPLSSVLARV
jgi:hypothetical protein